MDSVKNVDDATTIAVKLEKELIIPNDNEGNESVKVRSKKKGRSKPSPEEIERKRAERAAAKEQKRKELLAKGLDPDYPPELQFIKRPMLHLHQDEPVTGFNFTLMTYNCLAQALIRRKLFPDSGEAVKWFRRSKVLLYEFQHYNSDVICLQEIDHIQYQAFWKVEFEKLGYESQFHRIASKNHGVAIVWKREMFKMTDRMLIDFDKETSSDIPPRTRTNNTGLILSLKFSDKILSTLPKNTKTTGIIIGTTHLFWHPFGTYERTRQCYVLLNKMKEFMHRVNVLQNGNDGDLSHWVPFFCGDFNSQPFDSPYLSMTSKPIEYTERAKTVIQCSTSYKFSKLRNGEEDVDDEEGGNIEKFGKDQPQTPVPETFIANEEQTALVERMAVIHNELGMRANSLYSVGYKHVHAENAGIDNTRGEPIISNWANTWRGLLDYIFHVNTWDFDNRQAVDSLEKFEIENSIRLRGFLRMPLDSEMPKHGQPHEGEYASDHLSMICNIELLL
ncbi:hypothetical protein Kpol_237p1 [Vanderwaltozyma polyspora DSM 70294]|uniref:Endonuclease/exonuclease/phosphatase domain-containing protein n=1 Tax=Vanderwaltozyma polyspora (strain ATCC 22028 / DSM 70294 / BCRC 21397 / CBS 2163 / NBRC 10782 / NRRL Y-8283 / UCD 57-17) TaxID=436907 RepID=A7TTJ8_VANPO|nr:uncharacterized protein Kpol_237p1 [Vanderwaltozyma polyspora DSM 70294]EDO14405.1 hypothetical protein Kpol_237p1 [Vanderwaltozyma polyspora DSM 70294]